MADTPKAQQRQVLGVLQVDTALIRDSDKASPAGMKDKADRNLLGKWSFALPVRRAWRSVKAIPIDYVARETYRPQSGQAIATWSPQLTPADVSRVMALQVVEVPVFGEPLSQAFPPTPAPLNESFRPSPGVMPAFGTFSVTKADGEHRLYVMRMDGDPSAVVGRTSVELFEKIIVKVGFTNDVERRLEELNAGLPPAGKLKWKLWLSGRLPSGADAKAFEDHLKRSLAAHTESLGGEFFIGSEKEIMAKFTSVLPSR